MAGFRKAKAKQAALKVAIYGPPGSGKTFSTLLFAEGLAAVTGKRVAFVDTETGTHFYSQRVTARTVHPEAFDFDILETRSITETLIECKKIIAAGEHSVLVIDSITHLWDAAKAAYTGKKNAAGQLPMHAWGEIKRPYKELVNLLMNSPLHVFILGREGQEFGEDEQTGEVKKIGTKMKAEGETEYEPHLCLVMSGDPRTGEVNAFAKKDRTGIHAGRRIAMPTFKNVIEPLLPLLGHEQASIAGEEETAGKDAEALADAERTKAEFSAKTLKEMSARIDLAPDAKVLDLIGKEITPELKKQMLADDVATLRDRFIARQGELKGA